jgi:DNA-binding IclR family transcriptional regulator
VRETSLLAVLKQNFIVYLHAAESSQDVRIAPKVGSWLPAHSSAAGKVQLAHLSGNDLGNSLTSEILRRFTPNTITDPEQFKLLLKDISLHGYALDLEEMDADVRCVAAPVRDHSGQVAGAVSVSGPAWRFSDERLERELIPLSRQAAAEIPTRLGYRECPASGRIALS